MVNFIPNLRIWTGKKKEKTKLRRVKGERIISIWKITSRAPTIGRDIR